MEVPKLIWVLKEDIQRFHIFLEQSCHLHMYMLIFFVDFVNGWVIYCKVSNLRSRSGFNIILRIFEISRVL